MAIDPRIALAVQAPNIAPAINIFENALMNAQTRDLRSQQEQRAQALAPFQLQQAQQGVDLGRQQITSQQSALDVDAENRIIRSVAEFGTKLLPALESGNTDQALTMLTERFTDLQSQNLPTNETVEAIAAIRNGDFQGVVSSIGAAQEIARQRGLTGASQISVGQRDFQTKVNIVKNDPNLETAEGKAAAIALGLEGKASSAAQIQIAKDPELADSVAESEAKIAGAKSRATEGEKLKLQRKHKPAITALVKLAEKEAAERGDTLNSLQRSKAALPGLLEAVGQLKELSSLATSTFGGKVFDFAVKQTGFGSTKGATSRAKFVAIVNNQVLPLLKETFGAAFTAQEGEALKATMGDPDASPDEKMAQLDAFVAQKMRDIETRERQLTSTEELSTGEFVGFKVVR